MRNPGEVSQTLGKEAMNPYNFSVLVFALCSFILSLNVFLKRQDTIGKMYFFFSIFVTLWGIDFAVMIADNVSYQTSLIAARLTGLTATMISITWYHFTLIYSKEAARRKELIIFLYLLAGLIVFSSFFPLFIPRVRPILSFKNFSVAGPFYYLHTAVFFILVTMGFKNLLSYRNRILGARRAQTNGLILATFLGFLGGAPLFAPVFSIALPQYGMFLMPLYPFLMAYSIMKTKLFDTEEYINAARRDKLATIGILAASINHEVRNPLYVIRGLAEVFFEKQKGKNKGNPELLVEEANRILNKITQQSDRAMDIIKRLSSFAKREVEQDFKAEAVSLSEVIEDILPLVRYELDSNQIQLNQNIPASLPKIHADRRYLEEIFFNLIVNAAQALKPVSQAKIIEISANQNADGVTLIIEDNGPGIPEDKLPYIFEPFYTTKDEGTGLGLYVTKRLVEKNRAKILVESKLGSGTKFMLEFKT